MARLASKYLGDRNTFILCLVCQHRPVDHVADGIDAIHICLVVTVGDDAAPTIEFHTHILEPKTLRVWHPTDGNENDIAIDGFRITAL